MLSVVVLVAGIIHLRNPAEQASDAVRVGSASGLAPPPAGSAAPQAPVAGAVKLSDLVRDARAGPRATTSTTRPRSTVTTRKATTTTTFPATTTTRPRSPRPTTTTTTTPLTPLTTLLAKVVPPAVAVAGALTRSDSGVASWFGAPEGTCAHRTLPMGTMVKVTRIYNGATATCKVSDRGPTLETGRLIDLSTDTFEKLAATEAGLIDVRIEW